MISIIIPAYQSAHTVAATLDSVRSQTFRDYEVLITDDESSDGTLDICQQYAREHPEMRISTVSIAHSGVASARNDALARACGEYVAFLDSDDRWMPEKLQQVSALSGWIWLQRSRRWGEFSILSRGLSKPQAVAVEDELVSIVAKDA